jgi:alpha-methylacyl-CoA racemase
VLPGPGSAGGPGRPLGGFRVLEFGGLGAAPFAGMLLADLGATVDLVDRWDDHYAGVRDPKLQFLNRGKRSLLANLKDPAVREVVLGAVGRYDALIEGYRPGVLERLGLGPDECRACNPALVYARVTGWGQSGPYARLPGHDINYLAVTGVLDAIRGVSGNPVPPLNLVGDMAGGGALAALTVVSAVFAARQSGVGTVADCAMSDGAALLTTQICALRAMGLWTADPGEGFMDGGSPAYRTYATVDGRFVAVGAAEPVLYRSLVESISSGPAMARLLELDHRRSGDWPEIGERLAAIFEREPLSHWMALAKRDGLALSPVLSFDDAPHGEHLRARGTYYGEGGAYLPAPMPIFEHGRPNRPDAPPARGRHSRTLLTEWGVEQALQDDMAGRGVVATAAGQELDGDENPPAP